MRTVPVPTNTKVARSSFSARAKRVNLSNFSATRGIRSKNRARNIPVTDTKMANPDNPADGCASRVSNGSQQADKKFVQGPI